MQKENDVENEEETEENASHKTYHQLWLKILSRRPRIAIRIIIIGLVCLVTRAVSLFLRCHGCLTMGGSQNMLVLVRVRIVFIDRYRADLLTEI